MTASAALVGALVGLAVAAVANPRRPAAAADRARPAGPAGRAVRAVRARPVAWSAPPLRRPRRDTGGADGRLAAALVEVASLLRAGLTPADAWSRALGVPVADRVPTVAQLAGRTAAGRRRAGRRGAPGPPLEAVVAAARVADELGAPLAAVLDQVAAAIAAQAEAAADVDAALAGPRASARVLGWLPALGIALGAALGADPVGVLLDGGIGTAAGVLGALLVAVGHAWSAALLRRVSRLGVAS